MKFLVGKKYVGDFTPSGYEDTLKEPIKDVEFIVVSLDECYSGQVCWELTDNGCNTIKNLEDVTLGVGEWDKNNQGKCGCEFSNIKEIK